MDLSQRQVCSWEFGNSQGLCYSTRAFFSHLQLSDLFLHSRSLIQVQDIDRELEMAPSATLEFGQAGECCQFRGCPCRGNEMFYVTPKSEGWAESMLLLGQKNQIPSKTAGSCGDREGEMSAGL